MLHFIKRCGKIGERLTKKQRRAERITMKKLLLTICLLLLTALLVACGNTAESSADTSRTPLQDSEREPTDSASVTTTEEILYPDVVFDTSPITGNEGEPLLIHWNPYLLSPAVPEEYESAFEKAITAILNHRSSVTYQDRNEFLAVRDNLFYEFPPSALSEIKPDADTLTLRFDYQYEREEHLAKIEEFADTVEKTVKEYLLFGDDDAEKALLLYHAVSYRVDYFKTDFKSWQLNAYYALTGNRAICYSFTDAYNYLLRQVGVEAWLVRSYRPSDRAAHGWSLVKVGNAYYHCDTTWESSFCSGVGFYYFAMNDKRRANGIALSDATVGEGILQKPIPFAANGSQFDKMSGDKYHYLTWQIDRNARVLRYNGKQYPYDNE